MASLEEEIESLTQLDENRMRSEKLRDRGRDALGTWGRPWGDPQAPDLERALAVRALLGYASDNDETARHIAERLADSINYLKGLEPQKAFQSEPDEMPI